MSDVAQQPTRTPRGQLCEHEGMNRHCSWRAGGPARRYYVPVDLPGLQDFLAGRPQHEALYVTGLGSNLLVRDGGLAATVVHTHGALTGLQAAGDDVLDVEAGVASPKIARFAARHDLEGAEFLAGIPGTLGGALAMNAGCYGDETWNHVVDVTTIDRGGSLRVRTPADFEVSYRHVVLRDGSPRGLAPLAEWFVSARLRFVRGDGARAGLRIRELLSQRIATQPLQQPNAGSVFRNPPEDHAARLIEAAGLKGMVVGGAQVSHRHANFIVNLGHASAADIETLIAHVQGTVHARSGVLLEPEVRIVGEGLQ